jgi:hypothetical protein
MSEWRELTWEDAMRRGYEALRSGEALYEEIDAEQGRSNIDIEKHLRRAELKLAQANAWLAGRVSGSVEKHDGRRFPIESQLEKGDPRPWQRDYRLLTVSASRSRNCSPPSSRWLRSWSRSPV